MSIRLEMSNGGTYDIPTDLTVEQWTEQFVRGPGWRVMVFTNGTISINRDQVVAIVPAEWPR